MLIPIKVQFKMAKTYHHIMKLSYNYHKLTTDTVPLWPYLIIFTGATGAARVNFFCPV